mmetsp:Transcript_10005/g.12318  ORF Transcript_10005/g.12318 Transcript_10005/m.12318 type:complete len:88 (+) Transcript_10005:29-292(+)
MSPAGGSPDKKSTKPSRSYSFNRECKCEDFKKVYSGSTEGKIVVLLIILLASILTLGLFLLFLIKKDGSLGIGCEHEEEKKKKTARK